MVSPGRHCNWINANQQCQGRERGWGWYSARRLPGSNASYVQGQAGYDVRMRSAVSCFGLQTARNRVGPSPAGELSALSLTHASNSSNKVGEGGPGADSHPIISASLLWRRSVYPAGCHHPRHTQDCLKASGTIGYDLTLSLVCTGSWRVAS
jgi:hypothetical protein